MNVIEILDTIVKEIIITKIFIIEIPNCKRK